MFSFLKVPILGFLHILFPFPEYAILTFSLSVPGISQDST